MKAIVCDQCGKVVLLEDGEPLFGAKGMCRLTGDIFGRGVLDLCEECANKLIAATRKE